MSPTPGIGAGVAEFTKPRRLKSNVVWRFEGVVNAGVSVTSPIFDIVPDGFPFSEVEVGTSSVIRVPSNRFGLAVLVQTTPNMRLTLQLVQDNGNPQPYQVLYVPNVDGLEVTPHLFVCPGRRCQFRLTNTPLGTGGGLGSDTRFEITNEGL